MLSLARWQAASGPRWLPSVPRSWDSPCCHQVSSFRVPRAFLGNFLTLLALSIFWIFLSIPTLFAQPIALAIKGQGRGADGYLGVQLLAGMAYIAAFTGRELSFHPYGNLSG